MTEKIACQLTDLENMELPENSLERLIFNIDIHIRYLLYYLRHFEFRSLLVMIISIFGSLVHAKDVDKKRDARADNSRKKPVILNLKPGEMVDVLPEKELLETLDNNNRYLNLGLMPEMLKFCGKRYKVLKRIERMMIEGKGMRKIKNTVILEDVFCDGEAHGGCQRTCYLCWREGWLKRVE